MNKAFLIGRLTRDPELRYSSSNAAIVNFSIVKLRFLDTVFFSKISLSISIISEYVFSVLILSEYFL